MSPETLFAYTAGHFDGEGTISLVKRGNYTQLQCKVSNTYLPVLEAYKSLFGGTISTINMARRQALNPAIKSMKQQYLWCISSKTACEKFLLAVEPYLLEKRAKAQEALRLTGARKV